VDAGAEHVVRAPGLRAPAYRCDLILSSQPVSAPEGNVVVEMDMLLALVGIGSIVEARHGGEHEFSAAGLGSFEVAALPSEVDCTPASAPCEAAGERIGSHLSVAPLLVERSTVQKQKCI